MIKSLILKKSKRFSYNIFLIISNNFKFSSCKSDLEAK